MNKVKLITDEEIAQLAAEITTDPQRRELLTIFGRLVAAEILMKLLRAEERCR